MIQLKSYACIAILALLSFSSCTSGLHTSLAENAAITPPTAPHLALIHDTKLGGIYAEISIADFNAAGFDFGDSIDVIFDNGYILEDIPYYSGYFTKLAAPLLVGYPGKKYIHLSFNDGKDLWNISKVTTESTFTIVLREKKKYLTIQETFSLNYSDHIEDYTNTTTFSNYRAMIGGNIKENIFFRSASPIDNKHLRAPHVDALMKNDQIQYVIDLADSESEVQAMMSDNDFRSNYFGQLHTTNRVAMLDLSSNFRTETFKTRLASALIDMIQYEGPYLVHCLEGKDRTGFIAVLMEGLCGASYDEMKNDYMTTYDNYYHINTKHRYHSYEAISELLFDAMLAYLINDENIHISNYSPFIRSYLKNGGMTDDQIQHLSERICKPAESDGI